MSSNIMFTKDIDNKVFDYVDPWGETLASIAWVIRSSYHCNIQATPVQVIFGRDMIFNLASVIDWRVITNGKQQQLETDNMRENARQVTNEYAIEDPVHGDMTGIYCKLYYS